MQGVMQRNTRRHRNTIGVCIASVSCIALHDIKIDCMLCVVAGPIGLIHIVCWDKFRFRSGVKIVWYLHEGVQIKYVL